MDPDRTRDHDGGLRDWAARELGALPLPPAPRDFAPRVLAAIEVRTRQPVRPRSWFEWPRAWQIASAGFGLGLVGLAAVVQPGPLATAGLRLLDVGRQSAAAELLGALADVRWLLESMVAVWTGLLHPLLLGLSALAAGLMLICALIGGAIAGLLPSRAPRVWVQSR